MSFSIEKIIKPNTLKSPDDMGGNGSNQFSGKEDFILASMNGPDNDKTKPVVNMLVLAYRDAKTSDLKDKVVNNLISAMIDSGKVPQKDLNKLQKYITSKTGHQFYGEKSADKAKTKEYLPQELPSLEITDLATLSESRKLSAINKIAWVNSDITTIEDLSADDNDKKIAMHRLFPPENKKGGIRDIIKALEETDKECNSPKIKHLISRYTSFAESKEILNNLKGAI
jgi:hypothetical protein